MSKIIPQKIDDYLIIDDSTKNDDVEVEVKKIEDQKVIDEQTIENSSKGLTSIAYAKRADNSKNAQYGAKFVKSDGLMFGVAITKSI
jgi:hypothetical protein